MVDLPIARHRQSEDRQRLLTISKAVEPDTPQDHRATLPVFSGNVPESPQNLACLRGLLASAAIASCFTLSPQQLLAHVDTDVGHLGHADLILQALEVA